MKNRTCSRCRLTKSINQFNRRKQGLQGYCKDCKREYANELNKARRKAIDALKTAPCADCGNSYPPVCMDFDHVRGEKLFGIAKIRNRGVDWQRVLDEVAKCDIVCANCHRLRTKDRGITWSNLGRPPDEEE